MDSAGITELPPGYVDEHNGDTLVISVSIFMTIMITSIALRFWAKALIKSKFGADDWLMILSGIFGIATDACSLGRFLHLMKINVAISQTDV